MSDRIQRVCGKVSKYVLRNLSACLRINIIFLTGIRMNYWANAHVPFMSAGMNGLDGCYKCLFFLLCVCKAADAAPALLRKVIQHVCIPTTFTPVNASPRACYHTPTLARTHTHTHKHTHRRSQSLPLLFFPLSFSPWHMHIQNTNTHILTHTDSKPHPQADLQSVWQWQKVSVFPAPYFLVQPLTSPRNHIAPPEPYVHRHAMHSYLHKTDELARQDSTLPSSKAQLN